MALPTYKLGNRNVKLGKQTARHDPRTLQFSAYLKATAPPAPPSHEDYSKPVKAWPMMLNDNLGDCTCACAGHMIEEWTTYVGKAFTPTDKEVLKAYEAVSGYTPSNPNSDQGAAVLDVLNYWRKTGVGRHKILAYAALEPKN